MSSPHLLARPAWIFAAAVPLVAASMAAAGVALGPMVGMSATSYSIGASTPGRTGATSTSLNFSSSSNSSYDPTAIWGTITGDDINGGNWFLQAVGADYAGVLASPNPYNLVGVETQTSGTSSPDFAFGDTISATFELVFTGTQTFQGLNPLGNTVNITTATLARDGGSTTDLATATVGTTFAAGTYTLTLSGSANSNDHSQVNLYAAFETIAVPGGGMAALAGGLLGGFGSPRRRSRR